MDKIMIKANVEEILALVEDSLDQLNSASNWGILDIFKGGFLVSMVKNSKLDRVDRDLNLINRKLEKLRIDLESSNLSGDLDLNIGSFLRFTDIFIDNIYSDILVQSKIKNLKDDLYDLKYYLKVISMNL